MTTEELDALARESEARPDVDPVLIGVYTPGQERHWDNSILGFPEGIAHGDSSNPKNSARPVRN